MIQTILVGRSTTEIQNDYKDTKQQHGLKTIQMRHKPNTNHKEGQKRDKWLKMKTCILYAA